MASVHQYSSATGQKVLACIRHVRSADTAMWIFHCYTKKEMQCCYSSTLASLLLACYRRVHFLVYLASGLLHQCYHSGYSKQKFQTARRYVIAMIEVILCFHEG
jgi:hypothetical protein